MDLGHCGLSLQYTRVGITAVCRREGELQTGGQESDLGLCGLPTL